jgi:chromosome segregation ATPase
LCRILGTLIHLVPTTPSGRTGSVSPHRTLDEARAGARAKVKEARRAVMELERRHERAIARVEALSRRRKALELELSDAESERDRTLSRMAATKSALEAAESRLLALEQEK